MFRFLSSQKVEGRAPSSKIRRHPTTRTHRQVQLHLEGLEERVIPSATPVPVADAPSQTAPLDLLGVTLIPGNASIPFSLSPQTVTIPVQLNSSIGVNSGTVTVSLLLNGNPVATGSANVQNGEADVDLTVPPGLPLGNYTLSEQFTAPSVFGPASAPGSLAVTTSPSPSPGGSPPPGGSSPGGGTATESALYAAFEVAIDTAAILVQGDMVAEDQLQLISAMFLGKPLASNLVNDLLANIGPAGGYAMLGIAVGIDYADNAMPPSS